MLFHGIITGNVTVLHSLIISKHLDAVVTLCRSLMLHFFSILTVWARAR